MTLIALIRHGPTEWNAQKRLQGRSDQPLSAKGREEVRNWNIPKQYRDLEWVSSPLRRARETADILSVKVSKIENLLIEMDWGGWEGKTYEEVMGCFGSDLKEEMTKGIDLTPTNGESLRSVRERFLKWVKTVAKAGEPTGAICHQGIIRSALSLAENWTMIGPPPFPILQPAIHVFNTNDKGCLKIDRLNLSLISKEKD